MIEDLAVKGNIMARFFLHFERIGDCIRADLKGLELLDIKVALEKAKNLAARLGLDAAFSGDKLETEAVLLADHLGNVLHRVQVHKSCPSAIQSLRCPPFRGRKREGWLSGATTRRFKVRPRPTEYQSAAATGPTPVWMRASASSQI
ncbi:hypothetical protein [Microvirga antarctica]|uniref:hypothetical protein n=1 Tax=Microvirga antarctica TaxID=2819233 RepID=UPI001B314BFB|nr:hypothetical protein [Microvirga antarctica]